MPEDQPKPLSVREKQVLFTRLLGCLITYAFSLRGVELRQGEGYLGDSIDKPSEDTPHARNGQHFRRLAQDLVLDVNGVYQGRDCPEWQLLGTYWKALHPLCRWGGDFDSVDLNHFSLEHLGHA